MSVRWQNAQIQSNRAAPELRRANPSAANAAIFQAETSLNKEYPFLLHFHKSSDLYFVTFLNTLQKTFSKETFDGTLC